VVGAELGFIGDHLENKKEIEREQLVGSQHVEAGPLTSERKDTGTEQNRNRETESDRVNSSNTTGNSTKIKSDAPKEASFDAKIGKSSAINGAKKVSDAVGGGGKNVEIGGAGKRNNPQQDQKKVGSGPNDKQEETDEEPKPKPTPWGIIGGAVGKFLGKLKPKQQNNNTNIDGKQQPEDESKNQQKKSLDHNKEKTQYGNASGIGQAQKNTQEQQTMENSENQSKENQEQVFDSNEELQESGTRTEPTEKRKIKVEMPHVGSPEADESGGSKDDENSVDKQYRQGTAPELVCEDEIVATEEHQLHQDAPENLFPLNDQQEDDNRVPLHGQQQNQADRGITKPRSNASPRRKQLKTTSTNTNGDKAKTLNKQQTGTNDKRKETRKSPRDASKDSRKDAGRKDDGMTDEENSRKINFPTTNKNNTNKKNEENECPKSKTPAKAPQKATTESKMTNKNQTKTPTKTTQNQDMVKNSMNESKIPAKTTQRITKNGHNDNKTLLKHPKSIQDNENGQNERKTQLIDPKSKTPANRTTQQKLLEMKRQDGREPNSRVASKEGGKASLDQRNSNQEQNEISAEERPSCKIPTAVNRKDSPFRSPELNRRSQFSSPSHSPLVNRKTKEDMFNKRPSSGSSESRFSGTDSYHSSPSTYHRAPKSKSSPQSPLIGRDYYQNSSSDSSPQSPSATPIRTRIPLKSSSSSSSPKVVDRRFASPAGSPNIGQNRRYTPSNSPAVGRGREATASPMGRGRSPTKRETTHGKKVEKRNAEDRGNKASSTGNPKDYHNNPYSNAKKGDGMDTIGQNENNRVSSPDVDSLDSNQSNNEKVTASAKRKPFLDQTSIVSNKRPRQTSPAKYLDTKSPKRIPNKKYYQPTKTDSSGDDQNIAPPKRIVCYYPTKPSTKIPHGHTDYIRQSSVSSVDSLFSASSGAQDERNDKTQKHGKIPVRKTERSKSSGVNESRRDASKHQSHQEKEPVDSEELFGKEEALAYGHQSHNQNPQLETADERQRYLEEMVLKSGTNNNKKATNKSTKGIVKTNTPDFIEYALHLPKTSSAKKGSTVKVSPKIMDSPSRCHVTQPPSDEAVTPESPYRKRRKDLYAHVKSPTKELMARKTDTSTTNKHEAGRHGSPVKGPSSRGGSPVKRGADSPIKRGNESRASSRGGFQSREASPKKTNTPSTPTRPRSAQPRTPTRCFTPKANETKVPYVSPYRQTKVKKNANKAPRESENILLFSYDPEGGTASSVSEDNEENRKLPSNKDNQSKMFDKESQWRDGSLDGSKNEPKYNSISGERGFYAGSRRKPTKNDKRRDEKPAQQNTKDASSKKPNRHSIKHHPRAKSEGDLPNDKLATKYNNNKNRQSRSLDTRTSGENSDTNEKQRHNDTQQQDQSERLNRLRNKYNNET